MKTVIVTGATSGIGLAVCKELLRNDCDVIGIGHSKKNCDAAFLELSDEFPDKKVRFFFGDLMQQSEVKRLASVVCNYLDEFCNGGLDAFISNAGCVRSWYSTSEDGYEQQFAINHLAGFLLAHYLLPYLVKSHGRLLITSSDSHKNMKMHWKDIMYKKRYHPLMAYKQSKLCNMLFAYAINERFLKDHVRAYGIDPGLVKTEIGFKQTGSLARIVWAFRLKKAVDPSVPAKTYAWLCIQEPQPQALYYYLCNEKAFSDQVNHENAERLFQISETLCGIHFGEG